jgi:hypothetical protein
MTVATVRAVQTAGTEGGGVTKATRAHGMLIGVNLAAVRGFSFVSAVRARGPAEGRLDAEQT